MTVYQISGLGAGIEIFKEIKLNHTTKFIPWISPTSNESIEQYAKRMAKDIDTSEPFILMGVSFGGIMIQEISKFLQPEKLIVISSVLQRNEIPLPMRIAAKLRLTAKIPRAGISKAKPITNYLFSVKKDEDRALLSRMMDTIDLNYLRWSLTQIGNWKGGVKNENIIRLHGKTDLLFPSSKLKNVNHWLKGGHFACIADGKKISDIVNKKL